MKQARITAGMVAIVIILGVIYDKYELSKDVSYKYIEHFIIK